MIRRLRREAGFALPIALLAMTIGLALAADRGDGGDEQQRPHQP